MKDFSVANNEVFEGSDDFKLTKCK